MGAEPIYEQGPLRLKRCRHGAMLYYATDRYIGRSLDLYGEFCEGELALLGPLVPAGGIVLDIGAHVGTHSLFFAQRVGGTGHVAAFEPQRGLHSLLAANLALNGHVNARAHLRAVGPRDGSIRVPVFDFSVEENFGGLSLGDHPAGEEVAMLRIDDLELPRCDLVKIDVEGMEHEVLRGADETLRRFSPVLYVEDDRPHLSAELIDALLRRGYRLYRHVVPLYDPGNHFGAAEDVFAGIVSVNLLGLPADGDMRIEGLPPVLSPRDVWTPG